MGTYLVNFIVYSMAMVGLLFLGVMVYKKTMIGNNSTPNTRGLKIDNALRLSPRKTLYIVNAGAERFLIAADLDRTTFLAKLNGDVQLDNLATIDVEQPAPIIEKSFKSTLSQYPKESSYIESDVKEKPKASPVVDYTEVMKALEGNATDVKRPVMRELLRKLNETVTTKD